MDVEKENLIPEGVDDEEGTSSDTPRRGVSLMRNIDRLRARGETLQVEFTGNGEPIGQNGAWFRSYLGVLARSKIPITLKTWKHVPSDIKDRIWDDVKSVFVGIEGRKKQEMHAVAAMWRNFKTVLTTKYITCKSAPEGENPLNKYPFLTEEMWKEFVASRQTPEFLLHSEEQRKRQNHNLYPHTMSRGGYSCLEKRLRKEKLEELKSMAPDSIVSSSSIEIPRYIRWKRGRMTKEGSYINKEASLVATRIDELDEQSSQGSFISSGKNDILTTALGTPEHPGRVRGFGGNVGFKKVFDKSDKKPGFSAKEIEAMIKDGIKEEFATFMRQMGFQPPQPFAGDIDPMTKHKLHQNVKVSCALDPYPFVNVPKEGLKCHLMLEDDGVRWAVAIGRVFRFSDELHGLPLPEDHMKVTVDIPLIKDSLVPVPTNEVEKVIQAIGSFIAWPKYLIELNTEKHDHSEVKKADSGKTKESFNQPKQSKYLLDVNPSMLPKVCIGLHAYAKIMKLLSPILIPIEAKVMNNPYDLCVSKADIYQLLAMSMLNTSCIELYMLHLFNICQAKNISNMFGFICPSITRLGADLSEKTDYIQKCFVAEKKECFIAPYIDDNKQHWMLLVIYPSENKVFWLDPLGSSPRSEVKKVIEKALRIYHVSFHMRKSGAKITWIKVKCPRNKGSTESGYFIMTYMRDIVDCVHHKDPRKCFQGEISYTQEEIDVTRGQWADFILEYVSNAPTIEE